MKIWKKLLQVDRVHLEFIGNASRNINKHYVIAVIVCSIQVFSSHDDKVYSNERKRGGHYKTAAAKRLVFFFQKSLCKKI